jgi:hypothetical protein
MSGSHGENFPHERSVGERGLDKTFRATASEAVSDNPQKNEKKIHRAVEKMFEKYPTNASK